MPEEKEINPENKKINPEDLEKTISVDPEEEVDKREGVDELTDQSNSDSNDSKSKKPAQETWEPFAEKGKENDQSTEPKDDKKSETNETESKSDVGHSERSEESKTEWTPPEEAPLITPDQAEKVIKNEEGKTELSKPVVEDVPTEEITKDELPQNETVKPDGEKIGEKVEEKNEYNPEEDPKVKQLDGIKNDLEELSRKHFGISSQLEKHQDYMRDLKEKEKEIIKQMQQAKSEEKQLLANLENVHTSKKIIDQLIDDYEKAMKEKVKV